MAFVNGNFEVKRWSDMTNSQPQQPGQFSKADDPGFSRATATAAPAADPATAAGTVTGAPGHVAVPGVRAVDFGTLSPAAADELGIVLQAVSDEGCQMVLVGREPDGTPILQPVCVHPVNEPNPMLQLWMTEILLAEGTPVRWRVSTTSRNEAALERASRKSEKIRVLAQKAVDLLDAASGSPYYATDKKPVLSKSAKAQCKLIGDRLYAVIHGQHQPLGDLFYSIASRQPDNQNAIDLGLAAEQLYALPPGTRSWLHKKSQDEMRAATKAGIKGDAFFWRTVARGTAPGHRDF
ncbi:hypothetical protein RKD54_001957 [Pseudarthrobacter sp. SLBN-100]|uniref:hypothetical protein n=1 Tax=Arthrobacter sp. SLBN-100 TaxID=2768450 RepID=UPI001154A289|nr:hypothetical protein [Arthrobacter sp. SLBN-100]